MDVIDQISECNIQTYSIFNILENEMFSALSFIVSGFSSNTPFITLDEKSLEIINNIHTNNRHIDKVNGLSTKELINLEFTNNKRYQKLYEIQLSKGKIFLNSFFTLHKVYLENERYQVIYESPFNILISNTLEEHIDGFIAHETKDISIDNIRNVFSEIALPRVITSVLPIIYSHEIIHSQIYSQFGSINNIFNNELLSIFIELLYLDTITNKKTYNLIINTKLNMLKQRLSKLDNTDLMSIEKLDSMTYVVSIITAFNLYNIYRKGNILIKKELINNIQKIFDGNLTLEEVLEIYDLNWMDNQCIKQSKKAINQ